MNDVRNWRGEHSEEREPPFVSDFGQVADDLCEKAMNEAKAQLHPLLQSAEVHFLAQRSDFLQPFKGAMEQRIARTLAAWQPGVQAIFKFDKTRAENIQNWDGSIHLLVKVPRLLNTINALGKMLDRSLVKYLQKMSWSRFQNLPSVLDVQQVTPNELVTALVTALCSMPPIQCPLKFGRKTGRQAESVLKEYNASKQNPVLFLQAI